MNDALFSQHAEASVERAIRPWRRLLKRHALEAMRDFLRDLAFTHPRFVATLDADLACPSARAAAREAERVANDVAPENTTACPSLDAVVRIARERRAVEKRNELVCTARRAIAALARRTARRWNADADDLESIGMLAVLEIADEWDAGRSSFTTFAWRRARSRMLDSLRLASSRLEKPWAGEVVDDLDGRAMNRFDDRTGDALACAATSYALGLSAESFAPDAGELLEQRHRAEAVEWALGALGDDERQLLTMVYVEGLELKSAATAIGMPYSTARRARTQAILKVSKRVAAWEQGTPPARAARAAADPVIPVLFGRRFVLGRGETARTALAEDVQPE